MTLHEMAAVLREALEDERRELGTLKTQITVIQERMDRMIDVAVGMEWETKDKKESTNG